MLKSAYKARHDENRMKHEGDVGAARNHYYSSSSPNLRFLLFHRYDWMNEFIRPDDKGIEVGCGTGVSRDFIRAGNYILTDFTDSPWVDVKHVDALSTPFKDGEFDFVVSSNMIHHVPYPRKFFLEMSRILKPGGYLLVQEINASFFMRLLLRLMRHEGYSFEPDVFGDTVCTDPDDLWSANCAIPNLLFDDQANFEARVPEFRMVTSGFSEFFTFINSGGVIAKTASIPLPVPVLRLVRGIDNVVARLFPQVFALQRQVVLQKIHVNDADGALA